MHRAVCDYDSFWNQTHGEPQRVAGAVRGAGGDFVFEVVLQGRVWAAHCVGVGQSTAEDFEKLPSWREVKDWPGKIVGVCDYKVRERLGNEAWDEGYRYWWDLSNIVRLPDPIPCRGNVGMWKLPPNCLASSFLTTSSLVGLTAKG